MKHIAFLLLINVLFVLVLPLAGQHDCAVAEEQEQMACHSHQTGEEQKDNDCHCPPFCISCIGCVVGFVCPILENHVKEINLFNPTSNPQIIPQFFNQAYLDSIWQPPKSS